MYFGKRGTFFKPPYSQLPESNYVSPQETQRLQNCIELEKKLLFVYLQSLPHLDASPRDKGDLHQVYIRLIEARDHCQWTGVKIPPYVNDCIDVLVEKACSSKKTGFSKLV